MQEALKQAHQALALNEVPIGAIVVNAHNEIIGTGYNLTETKQCQLYHAEVQAIKQSCAQCKDWRLAECTLYVTLEPCLMCLGLIGLSRIERLVYGISSPLFGNVLDIANLPALYRKHIKGITSGVLADEIKILLKTFFKNKRKKRGQFRSN